MPSLNLTVFIDKVESGEKRQTIRLHRKRPIKVGDTLYLFTGMRTKGCRRLTVQFAPDWRGDRVRCTETFSRRWGDLRDDEAIARADGFASANEFRAWFERMHSPAPDTLFDVIRWES